MKTNLKRKSLYFEDFDEHYYDAHIKAYQNEKLGIEVIHFCDKGLPISQTVKPIQAFLPHKVYNV